MKTLLKFFAFLLNKLSLTTLEPIIAMIKWKICDHRDRNDGFVPYGAFIHCCDIGGATITFEIIVRTSRGLLLKMRDVADQGWQGAYHIPGCLLRPGDTGDKVKLRLLEEVFAQNASRFIDRLVYLATEVRSDNVERVGNCVSIIWQLGITEEEENLLVPAEWCTIESLELEVESSGETLAYQWRLLRQLFVKDAIPAGLFVNV